MNKCLQCNKELNSEFKRFCNRSCSATFNNNKRKTRGYYHSAETIEKMRISGKIHGKKSNAAILDRELWKQQLREAHNRRIASLPFHELGWEGKRRRVIEEQQNKCLICNLSEWNNIPLTLEVDHIDGDNNNNARENLRALCPNCHSTTHTWRGKNKPQQNGGKISDEDLLTLLKNESNIRKALLKAGLAAKGNNYKRAKKLLFKQ